MRAIKVLFALSVLLFGFTSVSFAQQCNNKQTARNQLVSERSKGVVQVDLYVKAPTELSEQYRSSKATEQMVTFWIIGHVPLRQDAGGYVKTIGHCTFGNTKKTYLRVAINKEPSEITDELFVGKGKMFVPTSVLAASPSSGFTLEGGAEFAGAWETKTVNRRRVVTLTLSPTDE